MSRWDASTVGRLVAELAVIVLGVLLALAAESWWSGRTEAAQEREYLVLVRQELEDLRTEFRTAVELESEMRDSTVAQATRIQTGDPAAPLGLPFNVYNAEPRWGAIARVNEVRGPVLGAASDTRAAISSLASNIESSSAILAVLLSDTIRNVREALREIARIQIEGDGMLTAGMARESPELAAAISFHLIILNNRIQTAQGLLDDAEAAIEALDATLAEAGVEVPIPPDPDPAESAGNEPDSAGGTSNP